MTRIDEAALREAADYAAATARDVDGEPAFADLAAALRHHGSTGALAVDARRDDGDIRGYAALLRAVSAECFSSAFSLWAHRMVVEYLRGDDPTGLLDELLDGRRFGSIAMATAIQELAGLGEVPTRATPDGEGGYVVDGRIAWASNVTEGTLVILPAAVVGDDDARIVVAAVVGQQGFSSTPVADLLALGATNSASLVLEGVRIDAAHVLATSLDVCRVRRPVHFLLQSALCLGLADRCLAEAADRLEGAGGVLAGSVRRLAAERDDAAERLDRFAADTAAAPAVDVTLLRYEAARLAAEAARLESALAGGRSYVTTSATNRRLREAMFLPVQSPSEVQLRFELDRFGVDVTGTYEI